MNKQHYSNEKAQSTPLLMNMTYDLWTGLLSLAILPQGLLVMDSNWSLLHHQCFWTYQHTSPSSCLRTITLPWDTYCIHSRNPSWTSCLFQSQLCTLHAIVGRYHVHMYRIYQVGSIHVRWARGWISVRWWWWASNNNMNKVIWLKIILRVSQRGCKLKNNTWDKHKEGIGGAKSLLPIRQG